MRSSAPANSMPIAALSKIVRSPRCARVGERDVVLPVGVSGGAEPDHWESGVTIYGTAYWQAKRPYGQNVVKWIGPSGAKKLDGAWKRLHTALTKVTK